MALAACQQALITTEQLLAAGIGRGAIATRGCGRPPDPNSSRRLPGRPTRHAADARDGRPPHLRVSTLRAEPPDGGSHRGLRAHAPALIDVTVRGNVRPKEGIRIHRTRELDPHDVTTREHLRVTTPARTLLDLAVHVTTSELERAIEEAQAQRLTTRHGLRALLTSRRSTAVRQALERTQEPSITRSKAERRLLDLIRRANLPAPRTNARIGPYEVDFLWPAQRVVVEVDGGQLSHSTRAAFHRDRTRDAQLQAAGYRVIRVTWRQLIREPEAVIARLAAVLAASA